MSLTQDLVRELFSYDPETGAFRWNAGRSGVVGGAGSIAGGYRKGYVRICLNGTFYSAHRLAWLYVYGTEPAGEIDHINGIKDDNRIVNLRVVNTQQNQQNIISPRKNNKTGFRGVIAKDGAFHATIWYDKKTHWIGSYETPELAHAAYLAEKVVRHEGYIS